MNPVEYKVYKFDDNTPIRLVKERMAKDGFRPASISEAINSGLLAENCPMGFFGEKNDGRGRPCYDNIYLVNKVPNKISSWGFSFELQNYPDVSFSPLVSFLGIKE